MSSETVNRTGSEKPKPSAQLRAKLEALAADNDTGLDPRYVNLLPVVLAASRLTLEHYAEAMERAGQPAAALGAIIMTNSVQPL